WGRPKARAVDQVDFEVRRGEVFGLLGPNGSGKSTTVKLMLGLLNPTRGHIEVFGHSPRHVATKSLIGYLPEESYLYRYLNSHETLEFFGNLFRLPKGDRQNRAEQLLETVGLSQTRTRAVGELWDTMQRVLEVIRRDVAEDKVQIDTPTQNLENYFLQVVQTARQAAAATSGAISGARVAAYLRGEAEGPAASDKILERLAAPQPPS